MNRWLLSLSVFVGAVACAQPGVPQIPIAAPASELNDQMSSLHPVVARVTARVRERSAASRQAYLARIATARVFARAC